MKAVAALAAGFANLLYGAFTPNVWCLLIAAAVGLALLRERRLHRMDSDQ